MDLFSHYDERMDLLVTRHGGHFDGAEAQKRFVKYLQQSGRLPQYWIVDTREVASATFADSDIAYMGNTERTLVHANGGDFSLKNCRYRAPRRGPSDQSTDEQNAA